MFNPSEENVVLYKNTHTPLVQPVDVEDTEQHGKVQLEKEKSSLWKIMRREPQPEELQRVCEETQNDLSKEKKKQLSRLLHKHKEVLQLEGEPLGRTHLVQHKIHMTGPPIRQPPRRFPIGLREEGEHQIQDLPQRDVVEPSSSPWASLVV